MRGDLPVLTDPKAVRKLKLSNPKPRTEKLFASNVQVNGDRQPPSFVLKQCKVRKYTTCEQRNSFSMILSKFSQADTRVVRTVISEVLAFVSEKRNDWFPSTSRPKNFSAIQRCFNDPLDDAMPQLIVNSAAGTPKTKISYRAGRHHDVHLILNAVLFEDANISLEWKIAGMSPSPVPPAAGVSVIRETKEVGNAPISLLVLPDAEDVADLTKRLESCAHDVKSEIDGVLLKCEFDWRDLARALQKCRDLILHS